MNEKDVARQIDFRSHLSEDWRTVHNLWKNIKTYVDAHAGGTGSSAFIGLTDVPASYSGAGYKLVRVNTGATALEFATLQGTTNQVTVTPGSGVLTLALPQDIHTGASPTFDHLHISNDLFMAENKDFVHSVLRRRVKIFPYPGAAFGPGIIYLRLHPITSGNLGSVRVTIFSDYNYAPAMGFLEADYAYHTSGGGSIDMSDFRVTRTSGWAWQNVVLGTLAIENGYLSIPVYLVNSDTLNVVIEWFDSSNIIKDNLTVTSWATATFPTRNIQSIQSGLEVFSDITIDTGHLHINSGGDSFSIRGGNSPAGEYGGGTWIEGGNDDLVIFGASDGTAGKGTQIMYLEPGMWRSALRILNTASGFGNLLLMTSGGNVGIGTGTVQAPLHISNPGSGVVPMLRLCAGSYGPTEGPAIVFYNQYENKYMGSIHSEFPAGNGGYCDIVFSARYSEAVGERVRIKAVGDVGIRTSSPAVDFEIKGKESTAIAIRLSHYSDPSNFTEIKQNYGSGCAIQQSYNGYIALNASGGNVGVGTATIASKLHVSGGTAMTGGWGSVETLTHAYPVLVFESTAGGSKWAGIGYERANGLMFWTGATSVDVSATGVLAARFFDSGDATISGNLGVGVVSPLAKLHVRGVARGGGDPTYRGDVYIEQVGNAAAAHGGLEFKVDPGGSGYGHRIMGAFDGVDGYDLLFQNRMDAAAWSTKMLIMDNGNVAIGLSSTSYKLAADGNARFYGTTTTHGLIVPDSIQNDQLAMTDLLPAIVNSDLFQDFLAFRFPDLAERDVGLGGGWESDDDWSYRWFDSGRNDQNIQMLAYGDVGFRMTWNNVGYRFFDYLFMTHATCGHTMTTKIEMSSNGTSWTTVFTTGSYSSWPGHTLYKYSWNNSPDKYYLRMTWTPTWNPSYSAYNIYVYNIRYFGAYPPNGATKPFTWDYARNFFLPYNFLLGAQTVGTGASYVIAVSTSGAPSTSPTDMFQMYSKDAGGVAGKATAHIRNEDGSVIILDDDYSTYANAAHASRHQSGGADSIKLDDLATPDDNTDLNVSTARHGLVPKLTNTGVAYLRDDGVWNAPSVQDHQLLSATHTDVVVNAPVRGALIVGNATPKWDSLLKGTSGFFLKAGASDVTWAAHGLTYSDVGAAQATHASQHKSGGGDTIKLDELAAPTDITTLNATTGVHGLCPKLSGVTTTFLRGDGTWNAITGTDHQLLSGTHTDTVTNAPERGAIIYGTATPKWEKLAKGTSGYVLKAGASDISWAALSASDFGLGTSNTPQFAGIGVGAAYSTASIVNISGTFTLASSGVDGLRINPTLEPDNTYGAIGLAIGPSFTAPTGETLGPYYGLWIGILTKTGTGTVDTCVGAYINSPTAGTTNKSLYVGGAAKAEFNPAVQMNAYLDIAEQSAPATPSSGYGRIYFKTDGYLYAKNDGGTESQITGVTGGGGKLKSQAFTSDGTWTLPTGVTLCWVTAVGGGGGGEAGITSTRGGGAGGGGAYYYRFPVTVSANVSVTIGTAGTAGTGSSGANGGTGGNTTFGALLTAHGGLGGGISGSGYGGTGGGDVGFGANQATAGSAGNSPTIRGSFYIPGAGGGAGTTTSPTSGGAGAYQVRYAGGAGGASTYGGGGGAGAMGAGGTGGTSGVAGTAGATNGGAGGGGGWGGATYTNGGAGGTGWLLVEWIE